MKRHLLLFGLCCTLLQGCVLELKIKAKLEADELTFHSSQKARRHWCLDKLAVVDRESGTTMWKIEPRRGHRQEQFCETDFPLRYGVAPAWLVTTVGPKRLSSGHTYDVRAWSGNDLSGAFVLEGETARNVR